MTRDNVVYLEARFTEAPPLETHKDWLGCQHHHVVIDEVLRVLTCADCHQERLDPVEVLIGLARTWRRWQSEAEQLRKLRAEQRVHDRDVWERARDRHLSAHPDHKLDLIERAWYATKCRICARLERDVPREVVAELAKPGGAS